MKKPCSKSKLLCAKIQILRRKMIRCGQLKGYTHPETLKFSEKLDKLIFRYQREK